MGNKKSVLASGSRRDIKPSILPSPKFGDEIYVAPVAPIRLGILLKMFWAGCRTPPFYVSVQLSVTLIPFFLDRLQECGNVICSHAMILMSNKWNKRRWVINDWKFCPLSITHRLHIGFIDVIDFIDEICLECVTFVYTRLMPCRWFCRRPAFYPVWNNASLLYENRLPSASETRWKI